MWLSECGCLRRHVEGDRGLRRRRPRIGGGGGKRESSLIFWESQKTCVGARDALYITTEQNAAQTARDNHTVRSANNPLCRNTSADASGRTMDCSPHKPFSGHLLYVAIPGTIFFWGCCEAFPVPWHQGGDARSCVCRIADQDPGSARWAF